MARRTTLCFWFGAMLALIAGVAQAQDYRGRIQGTITDPTQAVVAGATVTLANVNTGVTVVRKSNESGHYLFDLVEPGTYRVTVEAPGFSKYLHDGISLLTRDDLTLDAPLRTGSMKETITVEGEAVSVQFNSSKLETTVDSTLTERMPEFKHSPFLLAQLDPSVIPSPGNGDWNPFNSWGPVDQSIGGGTSSSMDLQVDGAPTGVGVKNSYQPISDSVQEVNIQQNAVDAEFGHGQGSAITMVTKSGTNEWHGLAYYQGQYPWANALEDRVWRTVNMDRKQMIGGTFGNPIKKNKLFSFFAMEVWKYTQPGTMVNTVPTTTERTGDYSQSLNGSGGLRTIYDPSTTKTDASGNVTRTPFTGNVIPGGRIDPIAAAYNGALWKPNTAGTGPNDINNYAISIPVSYPYKNYSERVDYNVTDKLTVSSHLGFIRTPAATTNPTGSKVFENDRGSIRNATQVTGSATYTLNPSTVLNFRADYHSFIDSSNFVQASGAPTAASLWANDPWYKAVYADKGIPQLVPRMDILGTSGYCCNLTMGAMNGWWKQTPNGEGFSAQASQQHGKHFLKTGFEFRLSQVTSALTGENPGFGFDPAATSSTYSSPFNGPTNVSGDAYATFLLGAVAPTSNAGSPGCWACGTTAWPVNIFPNTEDRYYAVFLNDDFKISRKLTLNLGVRYEHVAPFYDAQNRMTAPLNLTTPNAVIQGVTMPASVAQYYTGGWTLNGAYQFESNSTPVWNNHWGTLSPRIGAAFRVNDKMSLRAGYARYFTPWEQNPNYGMEGANYYGFAVNSGAPPLVNGIPQMSLANPFPSSYPLTAATGKALGPNTGLGDSVSFVNADRPIQHSDRFNVGVQRELPGGIVADVTFFMNFTNQFADGTYTNGATTTKNLDMMDPRLWFQYQNALNAAVKNPFYGLNMPGPLANQQSVSIASLMVPYPQYTGISEVDGYTNATMHYQSLQMKVQKRFAKGVSFLGTYNYHRAQEQQFYDNVAQYLNQATWMDGGSARHRLVASGTWDVPLGRGRQFLTHANRLADAVLGGWDVTALGTYQSGAPIKFTGVQVTGDPGSGIPSGAYFNPGAVATLPGYTRETNPWYYQGVNGASFFNIDASITKDFHFTERIKLALRMDAFNVLNNANWGGVTLNPGNPATNGRTTDILNNTFGRVLQLGLRASF